MTKNEIIALAAPIIERFSRIDELTDSSCDEMIDDAAELIVAIDELARDATMITLRALLESIILELMTDPE